jgi:multisubunit Na+/H+ antiporter MnhG subunit
VTPRDAACDALLAAAVVVAVLCAVGVVAMRDTYQRIHFLGPLGVVVPPLVAVAVLVREGISSQTAKTWLAALALLVTGPLLAHATARAERIRERGDWRPPKVDRRP